MTIQDKFTNRDDLSYNQKYKRRHPEKIKKQSEAYRAKEKCQIGIKLKWKQRRRKSYLRDPQNTMFNLAKGRLAKRLNLPFKISVADINIPKKCPILKIPLIPNEGTAWAFSPTLDRVNNKKGYVKGNIRVISQKANRCKSNLKITEVKRLLKYMKGEI